jgi:hypothetical protein
METNDSKMRSSNKARSIPEIPTLIELFDGDLLFATSLICSFNDVLTSIFDFFLIRESNLA